MRRGAFNHKGERYFIEVSKSDKGIGYVAGYGEVIEEGRGQFRYLAENGRVCEEDFDTPAKAAIAMIEAAARQTP